MGFYGNISNVNKTNMTFDKIYSNRKSMDESCALDGVYAGRYVLVQYEQYYPFDTLPIIYKLSINKEEKFSTTYTHFSSLKIQKDVTYRCVILTDWENDIIPKEELLLQYYSNTFYRGVQDEISGALSLKNISSEISEKNYVGNFNIDRIEYNTSRGYDSTVWMKQYDSNGIPRYVNIAELNSVVPTFDVSVDAPTMKPQSPHFDADSTNIYYNLHVQPQWGFRVKEAARKNASGGIISDATTKYTSITYDENGAEIITSTDVDADIYFNKAGFDKNNRKAYVDLETVGEDSIDITPTGVSGQLYNSHKKGEPKKEAPDIQELSINLPSIGNMMSEAWDYIYGPERDGYMGQWKKKEDLVDGSIFTNNAIDNKGYILEGGKRKDFSSFDGRLKSISLCEGETIPVKKSSDGSIIGASINKEEADDWIATAIDSGKSNIAIKHKTKFEENQTNSRSTQTPSFGSSFNIPIITVDKAGHIISLEDNSVQLPLNGSSLELEGYPLNEDNIGLIKPKDNLITAFNKVENNINELSNNKMDKENPNGLGSFSLNRVESSEIGNNSVAVGTNTIASGLSTFAEGFKTTASGNYGAHAEGANSIAEGEVSHAEGTYTHALGNYSHAEGTKTVASGISSHAEGDSATAIGDVSHAEGNRTIAFGDNSHAQNSNTVAFGNYSHAEGRGYNTIISITGAANSTTYTVSQPNNIIKPGALISYDNSFVIITDYDPSSLTITTNNTINKELSLDNTMVNLYYGGLASGDYSHAEGNGTIAFGLNSHAEGEKTIALSTNQHVQGAYNLLEESDRYAHIVGNGIDKDNRSNAHTLDWDGSAWFAGDVYVGSTSGTNKDTGSLKLATELSVAKRIYNGTVKTPITITIPAGLMLGDINKEGKITQETGTLITKYISKAETLSEEQKILADIDGDNAITISDASLIMEIAEDPSLLQTYGKDILEIWSISSDDSAKEHPFYRDIILPDITEETSAIIAIQEACEPNNFVAICQRGYIRIYAKWLPTVDLKAIVFYGNGDGSAIVLCGSTDIDSKLSLSGGTITGKLKVEVSPKSDLEVVNKKYLDERVPLWTQENDGQSLCIINNKPTWSKPTYTAEEVGALPANTTIPTIPTNISAFNNDVGYLTEHQSLKALEDKITELENRIAQLENPTTTE